MSKIKCELCKSRYFDPNAQLESFADYARDDFVVEEVLRPLRTELAFDRIWEIVCIECLRGRIDAAHQSVEGMTYDDDLG